MALFCNLFMKRPSYIRPGVNGDKETAMANAKKSAFHQTHRKILTSYYKAEGDVWLSGNNA